MIQTNLGHLLYYQIALFSRYVLIVRTMVESEVAEGSATPPIIKVYEPKFYSKVS